METGVNLRSAVLIVCIVASAAGLNLRALQPGGTSGGQAPTAVESPDARPQSDQSTPDPVDTEAVPSTLPAAEPVDVREAPVLPAQPTEEGTELLTYDFEGVASEIVIAVNDGTQLELWSVTPDDDWDYQLEEDSADRLEVRFAQLSNFDVEATFVAALVDGGVQISRER